MNIIKISLLVVAVMLLYPFLLIASPFSFTAKKELWAVNSAVALYLWAIKTTIQIRYKTAFNKW